MENCDSCAPLPQKIFSVIGYSKPIETKYISDAPFGAEVFESNGADAWYETMQIPIDIKSTYSCSGYLRWLGDGDPKTYYATCYQYNYLKNNIKGDGSFYYYAHKGLTLAENKWIKVEFTVGPKGQKLHHSDARFMSIGAGINYGQGNGTVQFCGWTITKRD
jgi:hypothetical protein